MFTEKFIRARPNKQMNENRGKNNTWHFAIGFF